MAVDDLYKAFRLSRAASPGRRPKIVFRSSAQTRSPRRGECSPEVPPLFLGPDPWMIGRRSSYPPSSGAGRTSGSYCPPHHQRGRRFLAGVSGGNAIAMLKERLRLSAGAPRWEVAEGRCPGPRPRRYRRIRNGDIVPADVKLIGGSPLRRRVCPHRRIDAGREACIGCRVSGSTVKQGEMTALVVTTGGSTFSARPPGSPGGYDIEPEGCHQDRRLPDRAPRSFSSRSSSSSHSCGMRVL